MKPVGLSAVGEQANLLTREEPLAPSVSSSVKLSGDMAPSGEYAITAAL